MSHSSMMGDCDVTVASARYSISRSRGLRREAGPDVDARFSLCLRCGSGHFGNSACDRCEIASDARTRFPTIAHLVNACGVACRVACASALDGELGRGVFRGSTHGPAVKVCRRAGWPREKRTGGWRTWCCHPRPLMRLESSDLGPHDRLGSDVAWPRKIPRPNSQCPYENLEAPLK